MGRHEPQSWVAQVRPCLSLAGLGHGLCPHLHSGSWFQEELGFLSAVSLQLGAEEEEEVGGKLGGGGGKGKREKICYKIMQHPRKYRLYELGPSSFVSSSLLINRRLVLLSSDT